MRERESRKSNLLKAANLWVEKVERWVEEGQLSPALVSAGLPKRLSDLNTVRLFVLGRNFSQFSGTEKHDDRAAWANWGQVVRLLETKNLSHSPVEQLFTELIADSPLRRVSHSAEPDEIKLPMMKMIVLPPPLPSGIE